MNKARGFSSFEFVTVIAIVAACVSLFSSAITITRDKSADATRFSNLREVEMALDAYYADYGTYPLSSGTKSHTPSGYSLDSACGYPFTKITGSLIPALVPKYIQSIPTDPAFQEGQATDANCYVYESNGANYIFLDYNPQGTNFSNPEGVTFNPSASTGYNFHNVAWAVFSPGGINF
jgi:type II secretory pathway pseudopilin PulG